MEIAEAVTDHDDHLTRLIQVATDCVEHDSRRALVTQSWTQTSDEFPAGDHIEIMRGPLASVTTLKYYDTSGNQQTWSSANYEVDTARGPGKVWLAYNISWPNIRTIQNAVELIYVAGGSVPNVPAMAKQAILLLVTHAFENREPIVVGATNKAIEEGYLDLVRRITFGDYP